MLATRVFTARAGGCSVPRILQAKAECWGRKFNTQCAKTKNLHHIEHDFLLKTRSDSCIDGDRDDENSATRCTSGAYPPP